MERIHAEWTVTSSSTARLRSPEKSKKKFSPLPSNEGAEKYDLLMFWFFFFWRFQDQGRDRSKVL